eukprot:GAHX01001885.1.p1 GENE.GAHX01001885.1~~GAHX01001885.1.p1  ORF type:complete len:281 (+),score=25.86 GAHX01001885.1:87-929(+)
MYYYFSIPILILDLILVSICGLHIFNSYKETAFKPGLIMISTLILSDIPYSTLSIFSDLSKDETLNNIALCNFYAFINNFYILKHLVLMSMAILIALIIFTNYTKKRLNKIGWVLICATFIAFAIIELSTLLFGGIAPTYYSNHEKIALRTRRCAPNSTFINTFTLCLQILCALGSLTCSVVFIAANNYLLNGKEEINLRRTAYTFAIYILVNTIATFESVMSKMRLIVLNGNIGWVLFDLNKITTGLFATVYIILEVWGKGKRFEKENKVNKLYFDLNK